MKATESEIGYVIGQMNAHSDWAKVQEAKDIRTALEKVTKKAKGVLISNEKLKASRIWLRGVARKDPDTSGTTAMLCGQLDWILRSIDEGTFKLDEVK